MYVYTYQKSARFASCTALLSYTSYADDVTKPKRKMPFELTTNLTYSTVNYNIKTNADSILKWRDSSGFGGDIEVAKNFKEKFRGVAKFSYTHLGGGTMSDYDMENLYPAAGVFSETKSMQGENLSWALLGGYNLINNQKHRFTLLAGYEGRRVAFDPSNGYQVSANNVPSLLPLIDNTVRLFPGTMQNVQAELHGVQIGVDYLKNVSEDYRIGATVSAFLPLYYMSKQYNWGYGNNDCDWRMENTNFGEMGGLSLKLQNQMKVTQGIWWNIYVFGNALAVNKPTEVDRRDDQDFNSARGKNVVLTQFGIGTGFTFE